MINDKYFVARARRSGRRRATLVAALAAGLALSASACGSNNDPSPAGAQPSNVSDDSAGRMHTSSNPADKNSQGGGTANGGGSSNGNGTGSGGTVGSWTVAFAKCMRAHGVSNFPDPNGQAGQLGPASGVDPGSAAYLKALNGSCKSLAPQAWLTDGKGSVKGGGS